MVGEKEGSGIVGKTKVLDVLIGIVQNGVKVAAQVCQMVIHRQQHLLQPAAYLSGGVGRSVCGIRFNQIDDGLGLGQVQLPVQKGPLGEFSPLGRSGSGGIETP